MCPACLATMGLLMGAVSSAGVATAVLLKRLFSEQLKGNGTQHEGYPKQEEKSDDEAHDRDT
jgi:hypothetical protein